MDSTLSVADYRDYVSSASDRAAIREYFEDCEAVQVHELRARRIAATDTLNETPAPATAHVLFPTLEALLEAA